MPALDADVRIQVLTYKHGLLSRIAHDLRFDVVGFAVEQDGDAIEVRIDASSLRVDTAMKRGQPTSALSAGDRSKIDSNLREKVLEVGRYPEIIYRSESPRRASVAGTLTLHGRDRPVRLQFRDLVNERIAEVLLDQRDYGIKPFAAMGGTLRIKPEVLVRVTTTWGAREGDRRMPVSSKA